MTQKEETRTSKAAQPRQTEGKHITTSKKVTDHLANERTFLAWIRTGLATITFGFVVERFGLLLRELGLKNNTQAASSIHYSSLIGVMLTLLGVVVMILSLLNFWHIRRSIEDEQFHPQAGFAILLTVLACCIGIVLAIYLFLTA
ncbi:MAG: DUF202 domain-containing protein [Ktedonobacteraceae bacterium]